MLKGRRVGTFTAGIMLIVFGLLFLSRLVFPIISYKLILSLWPIILLLLGIEIIVAYIINKQEKMRYDGGAIFLVIFMSFFAVGMACTEFIINNAHYVIKF